MKKLVAVINLFIFSILTSAAEKIPFRYTTEISTTTLPIEWNEKWFGQQSSYEYNHGIARIACFMSAIAYDEKMLLENYRLLGISEKDMDCTTMWITAIPFGETISAPSALLQKR